MIALKPVITKHGLAALLRADNLGLSAKITHIALGDADGYQPTGIDPALRRERLRLAIGGGERVGHNQIHLAALADDSAEFWIKEVGFFLSDGTLLAVWSDPDTPLAYKSANVPLALGFDLVLNGVPVDRLTIHATGPSVNLTIAGPFALITAEVIRAHRLGIEAEAQRIKPIIKTMWR